jgi:hypothetical protein
MEKEEKSEINLIDRLIDTGKLDPLEIICQNLSDIDLLHFSQTKQSWRNFCLNRNVFKSHEEQLLKEHELILNSDKLDEEYKMLEDRFDHIDNISFYFYIKRRVNAAVNKTTVFKHEITHALMGEHIPSKFDEIRNENWMFEDVSIIDNIIAVGQQTGFITLIDLNTKTMLSEFRAFQPRQDFWTPSFRWTEVLLTKTYVICSATNGRDTENMKLFDYNGKCISSKLPNGRPVYIDEKTVLICYPTRDIQNDENGIARRINRVELFDLDQFDDYNDDDEDLKSLRIADLNYNHYHIAATSSFIVISHDKHAYIDDDDDNEENEFEADHTQLLKLYSISDMKLCDKLFIDIPKVADRLRELRGRELRVDYNFTIFEYKSRSYLACYENGFGNADFARDRELYSRYERSKFGVSFSTAVISIYEIVEKDEGSSGPDDDLSGRFEMKLENVISIIDGCRITLVANDNVLVISCNDTIEDRGANNLIYAIPFKDLIDSNFENFSHQIFDTDTEGPPLILSRQLLRWENKSLPVVQPIAIIEDMVTSGISISKSRIAMLHCNGTISDFNYKSISDQQKIDLFNVKSIRKDYKYKVCPIEYTTQPPVKGGNEEIMFINGHQLNAAMDHRFNDTTGNSRRYRQQYTYRRSLKIPQLTERLFNMKIFYGMNSYWIPNRHGLRLLSWKPKLNEKLVEDEPIMHRYRPVQWKTRALSELIVETSSIDDEYIQYRMENNGYLDFLHDVEPYTIDREKSEFGEWYVTESKGRGSDNEVPRKKKSKLSDEIEMLEKNELVDWVIGEALALACLHPVVCKQGWGSRTSYISQGPNINYIKLSQHSNALYP